jgi:2'-5' RNA ligase
MFLLTEERKHQARPSHAEARIPVNLFFAIMPDMETGVRINGLARRLRNAHRLKGRLIWPGHFHVTLHPVGDRVDGMERAVEKAKAAAAHVRIPSFDVAFDVVESFYGHMENHPFVLVSGKGLDGLVTFRNSLGREMVLAGLKECVRQDFTPHVTLLWADRCVGEYPIAPIRWTVREFALVLSLVGRTKHIHLARWKLRT